MKEMLVIVAPRKGLTAEEQVDLSLLIRGTFPHAQGEWDGEKWLLEARHDQKKFEEEMVYLQNSGLCDLEVKLNAP